MARDARLLEVFSFLGKRDDVHICEGLRSFYSCCRCHERADLGDGKPSCFVITFVEQSPLCIELFQIWAGIDLMLATELRELSLLQGSTTTIAMTVDEKDPAKTERKKKAAIGSLLLRCFALVLEHQELDTALPLSAQSRVSIASRLLKSCTRSLYRLLQLDDTTKQLQVSVGRLLAALTQVSESITSQFLETFNFGHQGFKKLGLLPNCSLSHIRGAVRQGGDLFSLGVLGVPITQEQRLQHASRREVLKLFCSLLSSASSHVQQALEMRYFVSQITRFLCWDSPEDCYRVMKVFLDKVVRSATLLRETKRRLCRTEFMTDLGLVLTVYEIMLEGWKESQLSVMNNDFPGTAEQYKMVTSVLDVTEEILREITCGGEIHRIHHSASRSLLIDCPSWLPGLHLRRQQCFLYRMLQAHLSIATPIMRKLNGAIAAGSLGLPPSGQPRLTVRWLRYASLMTGLLSLEVPVDDVDAKAASVASEWRGMVEEATLQNISDDTTRSSADKVQLLVSAWLQGPESDNSAAPVSSREDVSFRASRVYWTSMSDNLQAERILMSRLEDIVLAGSSRLLSRPILTAALLHSSRAVVSVGLELIVCILCRVGRVKRSLKGLDDYCLGKVLDRVVVAKLPEIGTFIQLFHRFGGQRQGGSASSPSQFGNEKEDTYIPFDVGSRKSTTTLLDDGCEVAESGDSPELLATSDSEEEPELPGLDPASTTWTNERRYLNSDIVEPLKDKRYSLSQLIRDIGTAAVDLGKAEIGDSSLLPRWCWVLEQMFRVLHIDNSVTKFDWSQLLTGASVWRLPSVESCNDTERVCSHDAKLAHPMRILCLLDAVWRLNCLLDDASVSNSMPMGKTDTAVCFRQGMGSGDAMPLQRMKAYMTWFERLIDLWVCTYRLNQDCGGAECSITAANLNEVRSMCLRGVTRFLEKTGVFHCSNGQPELWIWIDTLKSWIESSAEPASLYFWVATLRNTLLSVSSYYRVLQRWSDGWREKGGPDAPRCGPLFPVSLFTASVLAQWAAVSPEGLEPRELYLQFPSLQGWPSALAGASSDVERMKLGVKVCEDMCETLHKIAIAGEKTKLTFLTHLSTLGVWRNVLNMKKKDGISDDVAAATLIKTEKRIDRLRRHLVERLGRLESDDELVCDSVDMSNRKRPAAVTVEVVAPPKKHCPTVDAMANGERQVGTMPHVNDAVSTGSPVPEDSATSTLSSAIEKLIENIYDTTSCSPGSLKPLCCNVVQHLYSKVKSNGYIEVLGSSDVAPKLTQLLEIIDNEAVLSGLSLAEKQNVGGVLHSILDVCVEAGKEEVYGKRFDRVDNVVNVWLSCAGRYRIFEEWRADEDNSIVGKTTRHNWSRDKKPKSPKKSRYSMQRLVSSFHLCPFIRSQFPQHFPARRGSVVPGPSNATPAQTAIIRHLTSWAWLRVQLLCDAVSADPDAQMSDDDDSENASEKYSISYGIPEEWMEVLISHYYCGSLSRTDKLLRLLIQDPERWKDVALEEWIGSFYDFQEAKIEKAEKSQSDIVENEGLLSRFHWSVSPVNWLNLASQRRAMSLEQFPFTRPFTQWVSTTDNILTEIGNLGKMSTNSSVPSFLLVENLGEIGSAPAVCRESINTLIYDPAFVLPFLAGRLRGAWYWVEEQRRKVQGRPPGPLHHLVEHYSGGGCVPEAGRHTEAPSEALSEREKIHKEMLAVFGLPIDAEGTWLRRVASGGALELLILGLGCTDSVLRYAAMDGLSVYRSLLMAAEHDAECRASKQRRKRVWKLAARQCKAEMRKKKQLGRRGAKKNGVTEEEIRAVYEKLLEDEPLTVQHSFKELREIFTLIELLKNALLPGADGNCPPLSSMTVSFAASCVAILLDCAHPLYCWVNGYLTSRPLLAGDDIPMFLSAYWSPRPSTCRSEIAFAFLVTRRALGCLDDVSLTSDELASDERHIIRPLWERMNRYGVVTLMLGAPTRSEGYATQWSHWTRESHPPVLWNATMTVLLRLTSPHTEKIATWLIRQCGLLQWIEFQLLDVALSLTEDDSPSCSEALSLQDIVAVYETYLARLASLTLLLCQLLRHPGIAPKDLVAKALRSYFQPDDDPSREATEAKEKDPGCTPGLLSPRSITVPSPQKPSSVAPGGTLMQSGEKCSISPQASRTLYGHWIVYLLGVVKRIMESLGNSIARVPDKEFRNGHGTLERQPKQQGSHPFPAVPTSGFADPPTQLQTKLRPLWQRWSPVINYWLRALVNCKTLEIPLQATA